MNVLFRRSWKNQQIFRLCTWQLFLSKDLIVPTTDDNPQPFHCEFANNYNGAFLYDCKHTHADTLLITARIRQKFCTAMSVSEINILGSNTGVRALRVRRQVTFLDTLYGAGLISGLTAGITNNFVTKDTTK